MKKGNTDLERFRVLIGPMGSDASFGNNGVFMVDNTLRKKNPQPLTVIVSDGMGWDHVSVSLPNRTPWWDEMCLIKDLFFEDEEEAVQYHPPKSEYVNCHPNCLHLWRKQDGGHELPPSMMVGRKA